MTHHPIFSQFQTSRVTGSGLHAYDFLGTATRTAYKRAWVNHAAAAGRIYEPPLPPKNEHYLDWIGLLRAVDRTRGIFRMAELGAGWAPWLVRGALAALQRPAITGLELVGVEADPTHYGWMLGHFRDNGLDPEAHALLHGALADTSGEISFPVIDNPDENYGASTSRTARPGKTITVRAYTLSEVLARFHGPVDFLHIDVQGAEYEALPPAMEIMTACVRSVMIGTHRSEDLHDGLVARLKAAGWQEVMNLARNRVHPTPWGEIKVDDGFLLFDNSNAMS